MPFYKIVVCVFMKKYCVFSLKSCDYVFQSAAISSTDRTVLYRANVSRITRSHVTRSQARVAVKTAGQGLHVLKILTSVQRLPTYVMMLLRTAKT